MVGQFGGGGAEKTSVLPSRSRGRGQGVMTRVESGAS